HRGPNPALNPRIMPKPTPIAVAARPIPTDCPAPWITRVYTSRPEGSVPNQCPEPGGASALLGAIAFGSCPVSTPGHSTASTTPATRTALTVPAGPNQP